jgi:hypothetical protein
VTSTFWGKKSLRAGSCTARVSASSYSTVVSSSLVRINSRAGRSVGVSSMLLAFLCVCLVSVLQSYQFPSYPSLRLSVFVSHIAPHRQYLSIVLLPSLALLSPSCLLLARLVASCTSLHLAPQTFVAPFNNMSHILSGYVLIFDLCVPMFWGMLLIVGGNMPEGGLSGSDLTGPFLTS